MIKEEGRPSGDEKETAIEREGDSEREEDTLVGMHGQNSVSFLERCLSINDSCFVATATTQLRYIIHIHFDSGYDCRAHM